MKPHPKMVTLLNGRVVLECDCESCQPPPNLLLATVISCAVTVVNLVLLYWWAS